MTPTTEAQLPITAGSNTRTFTATVPAGTLVDIQVFPSANIRTTATGTTLYSGTGPAFFVDANSDNIADPGAPVATVTSVNGVPAGSADQVTSGGTITFIVTGAAAADATPVVFADPSNDDVLNLTAPATANANAKEPSDSFGIGGRTHWTAAEGALGSFVAANVLEMNRTLDYFTTAAATYNWDSNDVFQYGGVGITMAQFEGLVTTAGTPDQVGGSYNPTPSGISTFNVTSPEFVTPATAPADGTPVGEVVNTDAGATANDVVLNWDASSQPDATYTITRDVDNTGTVTAGDVELATGVTATTRTFVNEPNDTAVQYLIVAVGGTTGLSSTVLSPTTLVVPAPADITAPTAARAAVKNGAGLSGTLDVGDVIKVAFSEVMAAPNAGDALRLQDGAGDLTIADVTNGTNATFARNTVTETVNAVAYAAGRVMTITITAAPTTVAAGVVAGVQLPADIIDQSGNTDAAGNAFNLGGGSDVTLNVVTDFTV